MEEIREISRQFQTHWNSRARHAALRLDGSWPSTGVLDLLTFEMRGLPTLSAPDRQILRGVSCYLAELSARCWEVGGARVTGKVSDSGVMLFAKGGEYLDQRGYTLDIESALKGVLRAFGSEMPVFPDFSRMIVSEQNLVSAFALSIVTGRNPTGTGAWAEESSAQCLERMEKVSRLLGQSCVQWYERMFPDELYGQLGELYLQRLIVPPCLQGEDLPSVATVDKLSRFVISQGISPQAYRTTAQNLTLTNDEVISNAAFAVAAAFERSSKKVSTRVRAAASARSTAAGLMRPAVVQMRMRLSSKSNKSAESQDAPPGESAPRDYLHATDFLSEDIEAFEIDRALGLVPLIVMDPSILKEKAKQPLIPILFQLLAHFEMAGASDVTNEIIEDTPGLVEVRIQRLYLDILTGELDRCDHSIRALLTEPGMEYNSKLYSYWALVHDWLGNWEESLRLYDRARGMVSKDDSRRSDLLNDFGWALFRRGRFDEALLLFDESIAATAFPLTPLLNKVHTLKALERGDEASPLLAQCLKIAPFDRRVFGSVFFTS